MAWSQRRFRSLPRAPAARAALGALAVIAFSASILVVAYPFTVVHYPPITDLPFHAAAMSILRHYGDPAYHFREQFSLHFVEAPYWTMHGLGAFFALFMPIVMAAKLTTILLLLLLPAGLAVMFHGMKKSPLLGLLGLPFVWNTLTHWGFINFMAALGLFAMVIGLSLLVLDRPTAARQVGLAVGLLLVFGTHIFRFPFAIAAVIGTALVMYPATRRLRPIVLPLLPSIVALLLWMAVRPKELSGDGMSPRELHLERFAEIPGYLFNALAGPEERRRAEQTYWIVAAVALACSLSFLFERRWRTWSGRDRRWALGVTALPVGIGAALLVMYLSLPMQVGVWWYIYPREVVSALFIVVGVTANLPRALILRLPLLFALVYGAAAQSSLVAESYAAFDAASQDFRRIVSRIPAAPKLAYLVFDREDPRFTSHPFIHLPAWVQAERGGWLSFHFASWNAWPIRYREQSPSVPPPTPLRFEWTPERFDLRSRGEFFDWFLVRRPGAPDPRFRELPNVRLVDHVGAYWLYHREAAP
jgi:hypothetical protein